MGARLSSNNTKPSSSYASQNAPSKRQKISSGFWDDRPRLIPSLPDEISIQILARLPRIWHFDAKLVSRSWRTALTSSELYKIRKELGTTEEWLYILTKTDGEKHLWHGLDPVSGMWQQLPMMPNVATDDGSKRSLSGFRLWNIVGSRIISDAVRGWLGRKDVYGGEIPFCGCSIGAIDDCLYVVGGFCKASAVNFVWRYDPVSNSWNEATPMSTPRAYSKTSVLNDKLYVVGGVTRGRGGLIPLQSAEVFDPSTGTWSEVASMPFSRARMLPTAFLADLLKPIATGMTSYRGKLCVPQSLYCWPFFVDVGGEVFDPETNSWVEMSTGMGEGWPAKQAGTKLSVIVDEELYALDPSSTVDSARIKVYDQQDDAWKTIEGDVPIRDLSDSEAPYLLAGLLGKLHVITKDADHSISVMQFDKVPASGNNIWNVIARRIAGSAELLTSVKMISSAVTFPFIPVVRNGATTVVSSPGQRRKLLRCCMSSGDSALPVEFMHPRAVMDADQIRQILPHRYPFLLVDRVVEFVPGVSAVGIKNVSISDPFFVGHFPDRSIMPGVLVLEAMAQVGGLVSLPFDLGRGYSPREYLTLAGVDKVRFRKEKLMWEASSFAKLISSWRNATPRRNLRYIDCYVT
ncbi:hypothetical protein M569_03361 [Genlisea aurea]|uniref:F-box domain-containing protein n=1 Tax=Genlisea aurea TaxID=192259 RepID=S8CVJ5_9LAMI|nr:hypothetical protein M569_03361 [Genlisea aurea]